MTIKNANIYLKNVVLTLGQTTWDYVSLFPPILGEKFQLGCFNSDAIHYKWFIDGNEPSGVSITTPFGGSLLTINSFTKQFIGEYKCRAILNGSQDEIDLYVTSQSEQAISDIICISFSRLYIRYYW